MSVLDFILGIIIIGLLWLWLKDKSKLIECEKVKAECQGKLNVYQEKANQTQQLAQILEDKLTRNVLEQIQASNNQIFNALKQVIDPINRQVSDFQSNINDLIKYSTALGEKLNYLEKTTTDINEITKKLEAIFTVLHSERGKAGEIHLENLLIRAGLQKDIDFKANKATKEGKRPDFEISLPNGYTLAIDAKFSLAKFEAYINTKDEKYLKSFVKDLKRIIEQLAQKNYVADSKYFKYVVMYIPSDYVLLNAISIEPDLINYAYEKGVLLATPITMLAVISAIKTFIEREKLYQNLEVIYSELKELNKAFEIMTKSFDDLEKKFIHLDKSYSSYKDHLTKFKNHFTQIIEKIGN